MSGALAQSAARRVPAGAHGRRRDCPVAPRDVVVVGAGHNGLVAACYLARAGLDVVVLEALDRPGRRLADRGDRPRLPLRHPLGGPQHHQHDHHPGRARPGRRRPRLPGDGPVLGRRPRRRPPGAVLPVDRGHGRLHRRVEPGRGPGLRRLHEAGGAGDPHRAARGAGRDGGPRRAPPAGRLRPGPAAGTRWARCATPSGPTTRCCGAGCPPTSPGARWPPSPPTRPWAPTCPGAPSSPGGRPPTTCSASGTPEAAPRASPTPSSPAWPAWAASCAAAPGWPASRRPAGGCGRSSPRRGERIEARAVVTAIDPQVALLRAPRPARSAGAAGADLAAARRGNVVQALVHVATDRLPPYPGGRPGDWNGLQSFVDRLDDLAAAWAASEAGQPARRPAPLRLHHLGHRPHAWPPPATTPSTWPARRRRPGSRAAGRPAGTSSSSGPSTTVEERAPGFRASIRGVAARTPDVMERRTGGRAPTPCTSTSPSTSSARSVPPGAWPATARRSRGCTSRARAPTPPAASPAPRDGARPGPCWPTGRKFWPMPDAPMPDQNDFTARIVTAYASKGPAVELGRAMLGRRRCCPEAVVQVPAAMCNRHGLIAGATGTGKTKTLQLMAEQLSAMGVPVFAADVKGDLSGLSRPGEASDRVTSRVDEMQLEWSPAGFPVTFLSLGGHGPGVPVRATVSAFGPQLLAKVMDANETQSSSLTLVFRYADDNGLALLDLADLREVLKYLVSDDGQGRPGGHRRAVVGHRRRAPAQDRGAGGAGGGGLLRRAGDGGGRPHALHARGPGRGLLPRAGRGAGQAQAVLDLPHVAAGRAVPRPARGGRPRQAQARLLLRRGPPAVRRRVGGVPRPGGPDRPPHPVEGGGRVLRHPAPRRRARGGAGPARQPGAARPAGLHAPRRQGAEGGGDDLSQHRRTTTWRRTSPSWARARPW